MSNHRKRANLTLEQCESLPTPRLLAYYKSRKWMGGIGQCECCGEILDKEDEIRNREANEYLNQIKAILDTREHVKR